MVYPRKDYGGEFEVIETDISYDGAVEAHELDKWGEKLCRILEDIIGRSQMAIFFDATSKYKDEKYTVTKLLDSSPHDFHIYNIKRQQSYLLTHKGDIASMGLDGMEPLHDELPTPAEVEADIKTIEMLRKRHIV